MSFSSDVKQEMVTQLKVFHHCALAELSAFLYFSGDVQEKIIRFRTENKAVAERIEFLLQKVLRTMPEVRLRVSEGKAVFYELKIGKQREKLLRICRYEKMDFREIFAKSCCKRAFLRGAFLASGSISNPEKTYHLEFLTKKEEMAELLIQLLENFEIEAKKIRRKKILVVYLKEGEQIVRLLNVLSAHLALMDLENLRIVKDMRNSVDRKVNCETANLNKTVKAAWEQANAIEYIEKTVGLESLTEDLKEIAKLRLMNMEASLKELGKMLQHPIGRSGVNHRLQRILEISERIQEERKE